MKNYIKKISMILGLIILFSSCNEALMEEKNKSRLSGSKEEAKTLESTSLGGPLDLEEIDRLKKEFGETLSAKKKELDDYFLSLDGFKSKSHRIITSQGKIVDHNNELIGTLQKGVNLLQGKVNTFLPSSYLKDSLVQINQKLGLADIIKLEEKDDFLDDEDVL